MIIFRAIEVVPVSGDHDASLTGTHGAGLSDLSLTRLDEHLMDAEKAVETPAVITTEC